MRISDWSSDVCSSDLYLNIAETGIGTFGANAGAKRYFGHDATRLSRTEAARIAAVLPLPQKRAAISPSGFTRRYGNNIKRRIGIVARDGLDSCLQLGRSEACRVGKECVRRCRSRWTPDH